MPWELRCALGLWNALFIDIFWEQKNAAFVSTAPFFAHAEGEGGKKATQIFPCNKRLRVNLDQPPCSVSGQISRVFGGEIKTLELSLFSRRTNRSGSHFLPLINKTSPTSPGETLPGDFSFLIVWCFFGSD